MNKQAIYECMGVYCGEPAGDPKTGKVKPPYYGLVVITRGRNKGLTGYYDDDDFELCRSCRAAVDRWLDEAPDDGDEYPGEGCPKCPGHRAIVYLGEPFRSEYRLYSCRSLRPATPAECLAHQAVISGLSEGAA